MSGDVDCNRVQAGLSQQLFTNCGEDTWAPSQLIALRYTKCVVTYAAFITAQQQANWQAAFDILLPRRPALRPVWEATQNQQITALAAASSALISRVNAGIAEAQMVFKQQVVAGVSAIRDLIIGLLSCHAPTATIYP